MLIGNGSNMLDESHYVLEQLALLGVQNNIAVKEKLPESFLIYDSGNNLISVLSVEENEHQLLDEYDICIASISTYNPDLVITDIRHGKASLAVTEWANRNRRHVFLDPGSSLMHKLFSSSRLTDEAQLLKHCSIICSSEEFYKEFCNTNDIRSIFNNNLFNNLQLAICTLSDGTTVVATQDFGFSVTRTRDIRVCNSLGTGDVYRGFFLNYLLKNIMHSPFEVDILETAAKLAIAAATIQIESTKLHCIVPSLKEVEKTLATLPFSRSNTTKFIL